MIADQRLSVNSTAQGVGAAGERATAEALKKLGYEVQGKRRAAVEWH